jgi:thiazole synthase
MAAAFARAVEAGAQARAAGPIAPRDFAAPSTPLIGTAFRG